MSYRTSEQLTKIKESLQQQKKLVGPLQETIYSASVIDPKTTENFSNFSIEQRQIEELKVIMRQIGLERREDIKDYLKALSDLLAKRKKLNEAEKFSNHCLELTKQKIKKLSVSQPLISQALAAYLVCLEGWADGANLSEEEAFFLQNESFGCQTVLIRGRNGQVVAGHTEEWERPGKHLHIIPQWSNFALSNLEEDKPMQSFTGYPFVLPGSAFNLNNAVFIAVDSLDINFPDLSQDKPAVLANTAAWLIWYLAGKVEPMEIFNSIGPFYDGYAFNIVQNKDKKVEAKRYEVARDKIIVRELPEKPFSSLYQTNQISDPWLRKIMGKNFSASDSRYFKGLDRVHQLILNSWQKRDQQNGSDITSSIMKRILGFVPKNIFDEFTAQYPQKNENNDVIAKAYTFAYCVAEIWPEKKPLLEIDSGPVTIGKVGQEK